MQHCFGAANFHMPFVLQEHEVLHQELNNQNKALLERVRELVDAGDVKDTRIRELEAQVRRLQGSPFSKSYSGITLYSLAAEKLILCFFYIRRGGSEGRSYQAEIKPLGTDQKV